MFHDFKDELSQRLQKTIPGHQAHRKVMEHRKPVDRLENIHQDARKSAVLILLYPHQSELHTVFILRPTYKGVHSGQIGFPGGKVEPEDTSLEATALREAEEELAIKANQVEIIGQISPIYVPPSNFLINPFVGFQDSRPDFIPDEIEVEAVLECPLPIIKGEDKLVSAEIEVRQALRKKVKGFMLGERLIWGATGMMVKEFSEILEEIRSPISLK